MPGAGRSTRRRSLLRPRLTPSTPPAYGGRGVRCPPGPRRRWTLDLDLPAPTDPPVDPPTIVELIRRGGVDAELAGLLWLLLDGGVPLVVAGSGGAAPDRSARSAILAALLDLVPSTRRAIRLAGLAEDFAWLATAEALGWRRTAPAASPSADPRTTIVMAGEFGALPPADTVGDAARLVVRALGGGFGLGATAEGGRLEDVLAGLRRRPIGLTDDELTNLGVVLIVEGAPVVAAGASGTTPPAEVGAALLRVVAAHYLRPLARDVHGHPQRLPPAVLATWDGARGHFEHFAWGVAGELAARTGRRTGDFEIERERRSAVLTGLAAAPAERRLGRAAIHAALDRARVADAPGGTVQRH